MKVISLFWRGILVLAELTEFCCIGSTKQADIFKLRYTYLALFTK